MEGELLAVSGPRLSERFSLSGEAIRIGRAPGSTIQIDESGVAWEHCVLHPSDGRYRLVDSRTGGGTYVNGMRVAEHWLAAGDQITVGGTVLLYREDLAPSAGSPQQTLLRACTLLFLFRAIADSEHAELRGTLGTHLLRLIGDLLPCQGGAVWLGRDAEELRAAARTPELKALAERACRHGAVADAATGSVAVPLYVRGAIAGLIAAQFPAEEAARLQDYCETMAAVATLGAIALEAAREVESLNTEKALLLERLGGSGDGIVGESPALPCFRWLPRNCSPKCRFRTRPAAEWC